MSIIGPLKGFSKLSKAAKIHTIASFFSDMAAAEKTLFDHLHSEDKLQKVYEAISENNLSNFFLPYSVAPNFLVNDKFFVVPMVIEESSVVAAASAAAKWWSGRGGFHAKVISAVKKGQIHFLWNGTENELESFFRQIKPGLFEITGPITANMKKRGGGISDIALLDKTDEIPAYHQVDVSFLTADSMGANFINTCLEAIVHHMRSAAETMGMADKLDIIMAILSNYTPDCLVECSVRCPISNFDQIYPGMSGIDFARRFQTAVEIALAATERAVTHNKGIFNGMDAVVMATGNDFRATEAAGHAYACRDGKYRSLTTLSLEHDEFTYTLSVPLSLGTVGGLTGLHPLVRLSLELLGNPDAPTLMKIVASAGLANNFSAVRALVTGGIQKGHMQLHLGNILFQLNADKTERELASSHFGDKTVSFRSVADYIHALRKK